MLLVAVSGGIDSMCLAEKVRLEGGPFAIAHCNFHLRGEESDADEAFVRGWASKYGIECHVRHFDTLGHAASEKISTEMAARQLRYRWFGELCKEHGYEAVAVAHNANDNAETLILNLLRGTGLKGIIGMKKEGFIPDPDYADIPLRRPLLDMTREDIEAFAKEHGLQWREDHTNAENEYKRNKIRNLVFPVFKEINPSFIQTFNGDMKRFSEFVEAYPPETFGPSVLVPPTASGSGPLPFMKPRAATVSGGYASTNSYTVQEEEWDGSSPVIQPKGMLIMDADKAGEYIEGHWEQGDWIRPLGAPGKKKLQDWFTDHHFNIEDKHAILLIKSKKDPSHVLAVAGFCIDHSVRVTAATERILRISIKND
ncbi:MAG: tRNA lysidine(34) synthetase TilS [Bacteroidales bacterium]|nr:tRNA lysidine(34) synthetase TilS [Bacteroidales bacterium]